MFSWSDKIINTDRKYAQYVPTVLLLSLFYCFHPSLLLCLISILKLLSATLWSVYLHCVYTCFLFDIPTLYSQLLSILIVSEKKKTPFELLPFASGVWMQPCWAGIVSPLPIQSAVKLNRMSKSRQTCCDKPLPISFVSMSNCELGKTVLTGSFSPNPSRYLIQSSRHHISWITWHFNTPL